MMRKFVLALFAWFIWGPGFLEAQAAKPAGITDKLTVAAAANIATVAEPLKKAFLATYPQASLDFVFGASGALTTQIQNGAPFQVFMSADTSFPQKLFDSGDAVAKPTIYATGKLILLSTKPLDFSKGLAVLQDPAISQFALANPEIAPYGKAALSALEKSGMWDSVKAKVVTAQTITQALQFTLTATNIGFVNKSALYTKEVAAFNKEGVYWIEVKADLYATIAQSYVLLKTGATNATARAFVDFLASPEARTIFQNYGYGLP